MTYDGILPYKCISELEMYKYVRIHYRSRFMIDAFTCNDYYYTRNNSRKYDQKLCGFVRSMKSEQVFY